jgi:3',5'-cyclic AMP phosphodiesterase CpdA
MRRSLLIGAAVLLAAVSAGADEAALLEKIEQLEQRVRELEDERARPAPAAAEASASRNDWTRRVRLGGSIDAGFFGGEPDSLYDPDGFEIFDARVFIDAALGEDVRLGEVTLFRDVGLSFEGNIVRLGEFDGNQVIGETYVDFQGMGGSDWLNAQVGRFQIPVGESYLRYSRGYATRPFVSNDFGPWWWDEGVRMYGASHAEGAGRFGYVASVSDGDTPFNTETDSDKQLTLKLFYEPVSWLHVSASALRTGELGDHDSNASGALWLGESWARAFGAGTGVPNFQNGVVVADGPRRLHDTWLVGGDAIADFDDRVRLWLGAGRYAIDSNGGTAYDRTLYYWIAELILRGAWLGEGLRPFYAGVRATGLGTYDSEEGYLLDVRRADTLGWNMETLTQYSGVIGWDITSWLRLRTEYTNQRIDLVRGVTSDIRGSARDADFYAVELGGHF